MPNPGSERRARRRARQAAETRAEADLTNGHGEHWEGGLTDQRLLDRAVRERWFTSATADQLVNTLSNPKAATLKELAVAIIRRGMLAEDHKVAQAAVKNLLSMESQNQKDELAELQRETPQQHEVVHVTMGPDRLAAVVERIRARLAVEEAAAGSSAVDPQGNGTSGVIHLPEASEGTA